MALGRRAYDLLRGYVNYEWDRIRHVDDDSAEAELAAGIDSPNPYKSYSPVTGTPTSESTGSEAVSDPKQLARRILGVAESADFTEIRRCFERINRRADPANFPKNSPESIQASEIQRRVQWAYDLLTAGMDATEKRFRSLEI